jgi:hypothetical protein
VSPLLSGFHQDVDAIQQGRRLEICRLHIKVAYEEAPKTQDLAIRQIY